MFDKNIEYYNKGICPNCASILLKRPEKTISCHVCNKRIITRVSTLTKQKGFFSDEDVDILNKFILERIRRNFICKIVNDEELEIDTLKSIQIKSKCDVETALIIALEQKGENSRQNNMSKYRYYLSRAGRLYEKHGDYNKALRNTLKVCFLDINGCRNTSVFNGCLISDLKNINRYHLSIDRSISQNAIDFILKIVGDNSLSTEELHILFIKETKSIYEDGMIFTPEEAWKVFNKYLSRSSFVCWEIMNKVSYYYFNIIDTGYTYNEFVDGYV